MEKKIFFLLILIILQDYCVQQVQIPYTPIQNICKLCVCLSAQDTKHQFHHVLSCSTKNFQHILADWPEEFGTNHTGQEIIVTFSGNAIPLLQQIPPTKAILSFSCRHCGIKEIQAAAFVDVPNILRLDLSWNELTGDVLRPDVFRGPYSVRAYEPISLEDLDLSHNQIHTLDRRIFEHIPHLKRLNLAHNKFDIIDITTAQAIGSVIELQYLDLSHNELKKLPESIFKRLLNLRELILQGNNFKTVPESISSVGLSLTTLNLGGNPIEEINDNSFLGFKSLTHLNISGMVELQTIESGSFSRMNKLEVLLCQNNPSLTRFDFEGLKVSENLKQLDISNCSLKTLDIDVGISSTNNNSLSGIWTKLHSMKISNNPWHCDCMLIRILEQFAAQMIHTEDKARCVTPNDMAGSLIYELTGKSICHLPVPRKLKIPIHDPPTFLEPKSIALSIVTVTAVIAVGLLVGFGVVMLRRKLRKDNFGFTVPIRYTTVRNSTMSTE